MNREQINNNASRLLKIITYLNLLFSLTIFSCLNQLDLPVDENTTIVRIYIGENNSSARTILPVRDAIAGYQLTFSGTSTYSPVDITEGNSIDIVLTNGTWTITATAYKLGGVLGNKNDAIASGSITITISNNAISGTVPPIILTQSSGTGNGSLNYVININSGVSGYMRLFHIDGLPISSFGKEGEFLISNSIDDNFSLLAGRYIAEAKLENEEGNVAFFRDVIEIWRDTTTVFIFEPSIFIDPNAISCNYGDFNVISNNHAMILYTGGILNITGNGDYFIEMKEGITETTTEQIVVASEVNANIILSGVNINVSSTSNACAFDMTGANVNLTLVGENVLRSGTNRAGLEVPDGSTLVITEASTGTISATSSSGAGIGGGRNGAGGTISITGGTVTARGYHAGIGGGSRNGAGGSISITDGTVTATSSSSGAGIGGGSNGAGGSISITGGTVTATGSGSGSAGAGIGNGGASGSISNTGGALNAIGGNAVIFASSITAEFPNAENLGSAIVFNGINGVMYGNVTLARNVTVPSDRILGIANSQTLTIQNGFTLTNNGSIINSGNIIGTVAGNQPIEPSFTISGDSSYSYPGGVLTITGNGTYTIGKRNGVTITTAERIVVASGITANIILSDVNINVSSISNMCAFDMTGATVNLTLVGENVLRSGSYRAGLEVPDGSTLVITGAGTGTLSAIGGSYGGAGIGGGYSSNLNGTYSTVGTISITGGTVTAIGGGGVGAGIGGGLNNYGTYGTGGTISITGGTVTATSSSGAGIGGGYNGESGTISITSGTVTATSSSGAGIGGGYNGESGTISITSGTISITGGTVTATSDSYGAGIGGGYRGAGGTISITGGTVTATGGRNGAGIGGGYNGASGTINAISGNAVVIASSIQPDLPTGSNLGTAIVFNGALGVMYGNVLLARDVTIPSGRILGITNYQTLTIQNNFTLINNGSIFIYDGGKIIGMVAGNPPIESSFTISGSSAYNYLIGVLTITGNGTYIIGMRNGVTSTTAERIVVDSGVTANIILSGVNINVSSISNSCAFDMTGANVNLTLVGENVLRSGSNRAGLETPDGSTLVITAERTGTLSAIGGSGGTAGIGGGYNGAGGTISITGGTVTATGVLNGAGIGGGAFGAGGSISITGGTVVATGGGHVPGGAGIGGGRDGAGGTINITGGTVTAIGGSGSAGIGGSTFGAGGTISITGGTVTATSSSYGAGIGGGYNGASGTINAISGNAVIFASSITAELPTVSNLGPAIVFIGNNGTMYGNVFLQQNVTFPSERILPISAGQSLTIPSGITLTNNGTINNSGTIYRYGVIDGSGSVVGNQPVW